MRLSSERYEEIKKAVAILFEDYGINTIPVDVFEIAKRMKIKLVRSSEILNGNPNMKYEQDLAKFPNSYLYYGEEGRTIYIYLDDVGTSLVRQRFSLAHEISHIILGHTEQNEINESEANFGARFMLAPTCLALMLTADKSLFDPFAVSKIFDVSLPVSEIIARNNVMRAAYCDEAIKDYEIAINSLLGESLLKRVRTYI